MPEKSAKTLRVTQIRSPIGRPGDQRPVRCLERERARVGGPGRLGRAATDRDDHREQQQGPPGELHGPEDTRPPARISRRAA